MNYCNLIWGPSSIKTKPNRINIPYHLTRLYEVADYLESNNIPVKCFDMEMTNTEYSINKLKKKGGIKFNIVEDEKTFKRNVLVKAKRIENANILRQLL